MSLPPEPRLRSLIIMHITHEFNEIFETLETTRITLANMGLAEKYMSRIRRLEREIDRLRVGFMRAFPVIQFP